MVTRFVIAAFMGFALVQVSPAIVHAQSAPDAVTLLQQDWGAYQVGQKHVLDGINGVVAENQALKKERDELKAKSAKQEEEIVYLTHQKTWPINWPWQAIP